ncbi:MAG: cysteine desulfurase-like protein [Acidobacteria bacterium]|nr:MAG: cysteine desulfurase-like protein [Acidobacteriota bacterium]
MHVHEIRRCFPALTRIHNGLPVAYFDGPGGTQVPQVVADAMADYLFQHNANTHWAYPTSEETDAIIAGARKAAAGFMNARADEISFGANMTTITFHLARALGRTWKKGDEVIVTDLDHHANVATWRALEIDRGIVVRAARMIRETCQIDMDHLARLAGSKTRLIAIGGASNAVGTINDLATVRKIAKSVGALFFVDAVHLAPHEPIDVQAIDCDFLSVSAYKFYGPHIGILFARKDLLESLPFPKLDPAPDSAPERAETGTQNQEGIAGVTAAVQFMTSLGVGAAVPGGPAGEDARRHTSLLWNGLKSIKRVRVYGVPPSEPRTPTFAFTVDGKTSEEVARALAKRAIFASHGDFYAATVVRTLGVEGLVRAGCAAYTTGEEIERLLAAVDEVSSGNGGRNRK